MHPFGTGLNFLCHSQHNPTRTFFRRPLCLIPSTSHVIQRLTQSLSSFRSTCPNHLNLLFLIIKLTGSNPKSSPSSSLFFLSFSLTPHIHRNGPEEQRCIVNTLCAWRHNIPPPLSSPRGRPSASRAAEQTQRNSTFPRQIRSHADRCSRLTR